MPPGKTGAEPPRAGKGDLLRQLTPDDEKIHQRCVRTTMTGRTGKVYRWKNPKTGNSGEITPTAKPQRVAGRACRDFRETVTMRDGRSETISGRRCQNPDGSWDFVG
jgi:surface antigen